MGSWIDRYLEYTARLESPRNYHLWTAIAILGHVLGRRVWMDCAGEFKVYPGQMMVVLCSRSAICKKGMAMRKGTWFLNYLPEYAVFKLPKKTSPQHFLACLNRTDDEGNPLLDDRGKKVPALGLVVANELGTFLSAEGFAETMATHLADLNDAEEGKQRFEFRSWKVELWNPCVGMLAGITPKGVAKELPAAARDTGFFGRVIWVWGDQPRNANALTEPRPDMREIRRELLLDLQERMLSLHGPLAFTKQAREWFEHWYYKIHHPFILQHPQDPLIQCGWLVKKDINLRRVALIRATSNGHQGVKVVDCEWALAEINRVQKTMPRVLSEIGTDASEFDRRVLGVVEGLAKKAPEKWISERKIHQLTWMFGNPDRLAVALDNLTAASLLEKRRHKANGDSHWEYKRRMTTGLRIVHAQEAMRPGREVGWQWPEDWDD